MQREQYYGTGSSATMEPRRGIHNQDGVEDTHSSRGAGHLSSWMSAEQQQYFDRHAASLERALSEAVDAAITQQASNPLQFVASFLHQSEEGTTVLPVTNDVAGTWTVSAWLASLRLERALASILLPTHAATSELEGLLDCVRGLRDRAAIADFLHRAGALTQLAEVLWDGVQSLLSSADLPTVANESAVHGVSKFADDGGFDLEYSDLANYFGGLTAIVGLPAPQVRMAMQREHCELEDAQWPFRAPNYGTVSTSAIEWRFCVDHDDAGGTAEGAAQDVEGWPLEDAALLAAMGAAPRQRLPLATFEPALGAANARLSAAGEPPLIEEELIGLRLYSGPCYVKYNTTLRGLQSAQAAARKRREELCGSNHYATSLHAISSGIVKLSRLMPATTVYRGISVRNLRPEIESDDEPYMRPWWLPGAPR